MAKTLINNLLVWLEHHHGPLAYVVLGISAALEYLIPPLPGDTVTVFGVFLSVAAHYHALAVYGALVLGSVIGADVAYLIGRRLGRHADKPSRLKRWLNTPSMTQTLEQLAHNSRWVLLSNRFVPALRAFIFVGAGIGNLDRAHVAFWGACSAALWNGVLFLIGMGLGHNWRAALNWIQTYTHIALGLVVSVLGIWILRRLRK